MHVHKKLAPSFLAVSALLFPLMPFVAHASTSAMLTDSSDITISSNASAGATATDVRTDISTDTSFETEPIIITRADVRTQAGISATGTASSSESLQTHAKTLVSDDAKVSSIELSGDRVAVSYEEPAKLFGFIHVTVPVLVAVAASGNTSISYPWYSFFLSTDRTSLAVRARGTASKELAARTNAFAKFSTTEQAQILDALHEVLRSQANGTIQVNATVR